MTVGIVNEKGLFDKKAAEKFVRNENKFITDLLGLIRFPDRKEVFDDYNEEDEEGEPEGVRVETMKFEGMKPRAKSLLELRQRLAAVTGKKRLTYKEKLKKKGLKNRLKKKTQKDEKNAQRKVKKAEEEKKEEDAEVNHDSEVKHDGEVKPNVFNKEDKMVFSKIDFNDIGKKKKKVKQEKDPKKLLKRIEDHNKKIQDLTESGKVEEAILIKEKTAWKNALAKAQGEKIKDDPILLKKSLKKKEQKQRASKKKWEQRLKNVEKAKDERQRNRKENIQKRKKQVKTTKMKKAVKKGKVIPGY